MLSNRLKNLKLEKDVLQKDVAQYLNIITSAYGFYKQGKRIPDIEIITELGD
ncbi:helix-turn-helix domain-containing protein [Hathewaya limosa]|uniref:Transcriptional regulator with XRE-family HTH domain n=1 Tax=Hathewaya limosa TaxID=1536 RepID=A0ABU0JRM1_HATLI|nr:helix-turn-helix transcriptional regulator [Hathewaya limosa]MDQ0479746.1 transcriptional regulator with XRE-family HTH domain [Hathewaya limosa]